MMPPAPNREDIAATWEYLQAGISKIMINLQDGMDMGTVSQLLSPPSLLRFLPLELAD